MTDISELLKEKYTLRAHVYQIGICRPSPLTAADIWAKRVEPKRVELSKTQVQLRPVRPAAGVDF